MKPALYLRSKETLIHCLENDCTFIASIHDETTHKEIWRMNVTSIDEYDLIKNIVSADDRSLCLLHLNSPNNAISSLCKLLISN